MAGSPSRSYFGQSGRPSPFGSPVFAKFTQYCDIWSDSSWSRAFQPTPTSPTLSNA